MIDGVLYGSLTSLGPPQDETTAPGAFSLSQNYPNALNPATRIEYTPPQRSHVKFTVFNTLGQEVAQLVNADVNPGYHVVGFSGGTLASGVYSYGLQAGTYVGTKKSVLAK